jgi:Zn-dependent protease
VTPENLVVLLINVSVWVVPVLLAITFHEAAHAVAAWRLGDDTAWKRGRVSFNPIRHIDLFGTVLLPVMLLLVKAPFLIGWAKPVPVAFGKLGHPRRDMALVALAGPVTNILLAVISALLLRAVWLLPTAGEIWTAQMLSRSILINLVLAIFNMLPIPPLDGGRVLISLLPPPLARRFAKLEKYGFVILVCVVLVLPILARQAGVSFDPLRQILTAALAALMPFFRLLAGAG